MLLLPLPSSLQTELSLTSGKKKPKSLEENLMILTCGFFTSWNVGHDCSFLPNVYPSPAPWIPILTPAVPELSLIPPSLSLQREH